MNINEIAVTCNVIAMFLIFGVFAYKEFKRMRETEKEQEAKKQK